MWTIYRHAKGMLYIGVGSALHSEDLQPYQLYRCLYANDLSRSWLRPFAMFHARLASGELRFAPVARIRVVAPEDEQAVLRLGFDAWGDGQTEEAFLASYEGDQAHLQGVAYMLELLDGTLVSALNTVRLSRNRVLLARVATAPNHRRQGYATMLLKAVMELVQAQGSEVRFLLLAEVEPEFYERVGFVRLPDEQQHYRPWISMISGAEQMAHLDADLVHSRLFAGSACTADQSRRGAGSCATVRAT